MLRFHWSICCLTDSGAEMHCNSIKAFRMVCIAIASRRSEWLAQNIWGRDVSTPAVPAQNDGNSCFLENALMAATTTPKQSNVL
jgi:hypothetical protein